MLWLWFLGRACLLVAQGHSIAIVGLPTLGRETSHTARSWYIDQHVRPRGNHHPQLRKLLTFYTILTSSKVFYTIIPQARPLQRILIDNLNMRFTILITSLIVGLAAALPDPTPQGYTGPCSKDNCGVNGLQCRSLCVPWPSTDPALRKGCTCSTG